MRMRAENNIYAVSEQIVGSLLLPLVGTANIFTAPMQRGDDDVRLLLLGGIQHGVDRGGVELGIIRRIVLIEQIDAVCRVFGQT